VTSLLSSATCESSPQNRVGSGSGSERSDTFSTSTTSPSKLESVYQNKSQQINTDTESRMRGWNFRRKHYAGSKLPDPQLLVLVKQVLKNRQMKQKVLANYLGVRYENKRQIKREVFVSSSSLCVSIN
jgi:hypothetical protein